MPSKTARPDVHAQLRTLMRRHSETIASSPEAAPEIPDTGASQSRSSDSPRPDIPPRRVRPIASVPAQPGKQRFSIRLTDGEIQRLNRIIGQALATTGQRVTVSDVLRVGLGRVGGSHPPLSESEIAALRAMDGRRASAPGS